jgi:hypothetical protein
MTSRSLALELIPLPTDFEDHSEVSCPACCDGLVIHQPDQQQPARLLGICPSCSAWFLIDSVAAVMVRLPDDDGLRDACTSSDRGDGSRMIRLGGFARTPSMARRFRDGRV